MLIVGATLRGKQSFHRKEIDTIDPAYYTFAHGGGQTTASSEAGVDVDGQARPAAERRASVLHATDTDFDGYVEALCLRFYASNIETLIHAAETIETVVADGDGLRTLYKAALSETGTSSIQYHWIGRSR